MKVMLFARLRDDIGQPFIDIELPEPSNLATLKSVISQRHSLLADEIEAGRVLTAINQVLCHDDQWLITSTDEVALFPPMTGG
ncbi:MoaD/ThiS family protein [Thalassolituus sp.]|jgi:molybdopterin synthase sulfur carrier subunit|uniref:MoaD/ThiS family protein n=1 Tax=Thalassolituus sp. TaxID=2030822 RepID=UPI001B6CF669|nr:MoaD/ThiS family protein [Thalassolituus sp.]MBQ0781142.1 MoaD/ThiS family protein [Thalassolituus oleivorans]|tara:strand:- start:936 stop:1184 length:249 start_codon:yes stop_codon:yes gene_type:complete